MIRRFSFLSLLPLLLLSASCARTPADYYFGSYSEAEQLFKEGKYERAIQKYQAYRDENPEGNMAVIAHYYMAKSHTMLGHYDEAKIIYQEIAEKHPELVWANFSEAQLKELENSGPSELAV